MNNKTYYARQKQSEVMNQESKVTCSLLGSLSVVGVIVLFGSWICGHYSLTH